MHSNPALYENVGVIATYNLVCAFSDAFHLSNVRLSIAVRRHADPYSGEIRPRRRDPDPGQCKLQGLGAKQGISIFSVSVSVSVSVSISISLSLSHPSVVQTRVLVL